MLFWIGAVVFFVMSLPCGLMLGARVVKGEAPVWSKDVLPWAIGCHGLLGVAALFMVMKVVG